MAPLGAKSALLGCQIGTLSSSFFNGPLADYGFTTTLEHGGGGIVLCLALGESGQRKHKEHYAIQH